MTLEEILKLKYWWCQDLNQSQIKHELGLAATKESLVETLSGTVVIFSLKCDFSYEPSQSVP